MVQISNEQFTQLQKDADDNKAIKSITKWVIGIVVFLVLYFTAGKTFIDIQLTRYKATVDCEIAMMQAHNAVAIREVQSQGMKTEDYLKWYEIYSKAD